MRRRERRRLRAEARGIERAAKFVRGFDMPMEHWLPENVMDRRTIRKMADGLDTMAKSCRERADA